jgi:hypothetical protein
MVLIKITMLGLDRKEVDFQAVVEVAAVCEEVHTSESLEVLTKATKALSKMQRIPLSEWNYKLFQKL